MADPGPAATAIITGRLSDVPDRTLSLLEAWRGGSREALDQLLAEVLPWLHREVHAGLGQAPLGDSDSMDLVQTAITNFLAWGPRYVPQSGAQFRALLRRIATNELIDQRRRQARAGGGRHLESLVSSESPLSGFGRGSCSQLRPSRAAERAEDQEWVRLALQLLSAEDRHLLLASEVEGASWEQIAGELALPSADAARVRGARLKPKLANLLRQLRAGRLPEIPAE